MIFPASMLGQMWGMPGRGGDSLKKYSGPTQTKEISTKRDWWEKRAGTFSRLQTDKARLWPLRIDLPFLMIFKVRKVNLEPTRSQNKYMNRHLPGLGCEANSKPLSSHLFPVTAKNQVC